MWTAVAFSLILAVLVVVLVFQWQRGRSPRPLGGGRAGSFVQGTFTVTGVSDRPDHGDKKGERFCTISGTINGPQTQPAEVYGTLVVGENDPWPQIGADLAVVYKPGKASTSWQFGELPPPPPIGAEDTGPRPPA
ncbi:hypothetical protein [Gordonia soli]|nr:hypothetical protein [Gordonia soli]